MGLFVAYNWHKSVLTNLRSLKKTQKETRFLRDQQSNYMADINSKINICIVMSFHYTSIAHYYDITKNQKRP